MSLSKSIPSIKSLKLSAKKIASKKNIPLSQELDLVANDYGFTHWTLMHKYFRTVRMNNVESIWQSFLHGEMLLLSAAAGSGKLSLALNLALYAAQIKLPVKYYSMHVDASFIFERLNKISGTNSECDLQQGQYMRVEYRSFDQNTLIEKIKKDKNSSLLIIDYLQAIVSHGEIESDNIKLRLYNRAKTIADCFKHRNKIGLDVAIEALKEAYTKNKVTVDELWHYAKICRVANVMRPYIEAIQ